MTVLPICPSTTRSSSGSAGIGPHRFTLDREPGNARAKALLADIEDQDPDRALTTSLALEKEINTFFRLHNPSVIARLRETFPDLPAEPDARSVFLKLRELRNSW